ncbi:MAG: hypothetical protein AAFQ22_03230 [Pseudomonadota bacterium]
MKDFILFMHADGANTQDTDWGEYLFKLQSSGQFDGGSAVGEGQSFRKSEAPAPVTSHLTGYLRVRAASLSAAKELLIGNPVYEAGGTVEIRELPRT